MPSGNLQGAGLIGKLDIQTLGEVQVLLNGKPVAGLASRKAEALLIYLACTRRIHRRDPLADLLWDGRTDRQAQANLSVVLTSLRKRLGRFLDIGRETVGLAEGAPVSVDFLDLTTALEPFAAGDEDADIEALTEAVGRYRGEFLRGYHLRGARGFDEWVTVVRERTERAVLEGLRRLAFGRLQDGEVEAALSALRRALELDPLQEDLHRETMRALALGGRSSEALAQYLACARRLRQELDVEPAEATRGLYQRLLARRERPTDNLPVLTTQTIGRAEDLRGIVDALRQPGSRLLSLVGTGGIGKTRLALEAALRLRASFLEGVWFVDLAALDDDGRVAEAIGRALVVPESQVRKEVADSSLERLVEYLRDRELLLVLDNCEHLVGACRDVAEAVLAACPQVRILATGRRRLDLPQERVFEVEPLPVPDLTDGPLPGLKHLAANDSIRLFVERARDVLASFDLEEDNAPALVGLCRMLDGLPLAIELAASRVRSLSLEQIADRLGARLGSVGYETLHAAPRHRTLGEAIRWSYDLLEEDDRRLFRLTSVFRGGFARRALVDVAQALALAPREAESGLARLVEQSLVSRRPQEGGAERYTLLEPVRQFGHELMEADPALDSCLERHAAYYLEVAEALGPSLHGRERASCVAVLETEADNLRAALRYFVRARRGRDSLRLNHALWEGFWLNQGYFIEGRRWVEQALASGDEGESFLYGSGLIARGAFAWTLGHLDASVASLDQALSLGERRSDPQLLQWALYWKAMVIFDHSRFDEAEALLDRGLSLARRAGETRGAAWHLFYLAQIARVRGQVQPAVRLYSEALAVLDQEDVFGAGWCHIYLGHLAIEQHDLEAARGHLEQSRQIYAGLQNPRGLGGTERGLGLVELEAGNLGKAEEHLQRSRYWFERLAWIKMASSSMIYLGHIAAQDGRRSEAADLLTRSLAYQQREHDRHSIAHLLLELGLLAAHHAETDVAACLFGAADSMQQELQVTFPNYLVRAVAAVRGAIDADRVAVARCRIHWERCVTLILENPVTWLERMAEAVRTGGDSLTAGEEIEAL